MKITYQKKFIYKPYLDMWSEFHMLKEKTRDMVALYNKIPLDELAELMPDFAWDAYLSAAAVTSIDGLVVTQVDYMGALNDIIKDTGMAACLAA